MHLGLAAQGPTGPDGGGQWVPSAFLHLSLAHCHPQEHSLVWPGLLPLSQEKPHIQIFM